MDDFLAACIAQNRLDVAGGSPGDLHGIHRIIGDKPARDLAAIAARTTTQSPRLKEPSTRRTPAGSRLFPARMAVAAPSSIVNVPRGSSVPPIQRLRAVTGVEGERNHVQRPPRARREWGGGACHWR